MTGVRFRAPDPSVPVRPLHRLQTRIGLATGALVMLLAFAMAAVLSVAAERQVAALSSENLENLADQMARELSHGMDVFAKEVVNQTQRDRYRSSRTSVAEMRQSLNEFRAANPEFAYVSIVDAADARVVAASGGIFEGGSARGRPTFERGLGGVFIGDVHEAVRLAELLPRPANGEPLRFLDVAAPIVDESGRVVRVFATHVGFEWTRSVRENVLAPVEGRRGVQVFVVDTAGKVVLTDSAAIPVGTDLRALAAAQPGGSRLLDWPDGRSFLTDVVATRPHGRFPGFGWRVVARQPYAIAVAPVRDLRVAFGAGAVFVGLAGALAAWLVAARLVRPVRRLADAARAASHHQGPVTMPSDERIGELSEVRAAIVRLASSAREQAQASELSDRRFELFAGSLPQVVWHAGADGRIEYVNHPELFAAAGAPPYRVESLIALMVDDDAERFAQAWRAACAAGSELRLRCRMRVGNPPQPRWFDVEARPVRVDAAAARWVGTVFDVHDIVDLSERRARALAEERVAREQAERLATARDQFLSVLSHELRSPLSAITGWADILARKSDASDRMWVKGVTVIRRNAALQVALITDLLDLTAIAAGRVELHLTGFDLAARVAQVCDAHREAAQAKGVELVVPAHPPLTVQADPRRIGQVVSKLVDNAIKFTDRGGRVRVDLATRGDRATVSVGDTGRGIDTAYLPNVFDRMRQQDGSTTRRSGGLGIGLSIAKSLVELHGGRLEARSDGVDRGATFTFDLPLGALSAPAQRQDRPDADETGSEPTLHGLRILLVDDEADAREVAQIALSSLGAQVRAVASAAEALPLLERGPFDVLVSDIGMPGTDGIAFIQAVRRLDAPALAAIPAVALTAFALESDRRAALEAGFQTHVAKPISLRRLAESIGEAQRAARSAAAVPDSPTMRR